MNDYITSKERLTFTKKRIKYEGIFWSVIAIVTTYALLLQVTNSLG